MANTKSAKAYVEITKRNRKRNLEQSAQVKALFKTLRKMESPTKAELEALLSNIYRTLDKVSHQVIHPNKADRLKARAAKTIKAFMENAK